MQLHVNVIGMETAVSAIAGEVLHLVGELAAAVIAASWITFRVLIGKHASGGFVDGFGDEVLAGDQLNLAVLPLGFAENELDRWRDRLRREGARWNCS